MTPVEVDPAEFTNEAATFPASLSGSFRWVEKATGFAF
jgi:hypothetical protein